MLVLLGVALLHCCQAFLQQFPPQDQIASLPFSRRGHGSVEDSRSFKSSVSDFLDTAEVVSSPSKDIRPPPPTIDGVYFIKCGRCNAAYELRSDTIKPEGQRVKCEVCGHTWFQAANRLQTLADGYMFKDYPEDLKSRVNENIQSQRHPLDTSSLKGEISIFVGNLPFSVSEQGVEEMFKEHGKVVSVTIVKDALNRSKGFGFIEMASKEEGTAAIAAIDGREIEGRTINARPGTSRPQPKMRRERTIQKREYQAPTTRDYRTSSSSSPEGGGARGGPVKGSVASFLEDEP